MNTLSQLRNKTMTEELKQKAKEMFAKWKSEQYKDQSTE